VRTSFRNLALLLSLSVPLTGQSIASQIPHRVEAFVAAGNIAGAVTLVSRGNEIIEFDAVGMADIEAKHPMRKDTIFRSRRASPPTPVPITRAWRFQITPSPSAICSPIPPAFPMPRPPPFPITNSS